MLASPNGTDFLKHSWRVLFAIRRCPFAQVVHHHSYLFSEKEGTTEEQTTNTRGEGRKKKEAKGLQA